MAITHWMGHLALVSGFRWVSPEVKGLPEPKCCLLVQIELECVFKVLTDPAVESRSDPITDVNENVM
jgi:hypothetical protein